MALCILFDVNQIVASLRNLLSIAPANLVVPSAILCGLNMDGAAKGTVKRSFCFPLPAPFANIERKEPILIRYPSTFRWVSLLISLLVVKGPSAEVFLVTDLMTILPRCCMLQTFEPSKLEML